MSRPYCQLCGLRRDMVDMASKTRCRDCAVNLVNIRMLHVINRDYSRFFDDPARQERIRVYTERASLRLPLFPAYHRKRSAA